MSLTIWCDTKFSDAVTKRLVDGAKPHRVIFSPNASASGLSGGARDSSLADADIAFGQPAVQDCVDYPRIRWIELSTAGYTRYDREDFKEILRKRGVPLTSVSQVYAESCAQHVLAMMLGLARQLPQAMRDQMTDHSWRWSEHRYNSRSLVGQTVLLLGFGAIGRRLVELLAPFRMTVLALRRQSRSESAVRIIPAENISSALAESDHVVNILPENDSTLGFVNARRLACCKPGARFYNVGRGTTVDQAALLESLRSRRLDAAYLDVTVPEPLPVEHPFWTTPNCFITPHAAGGRHDQDEALVDHFLANLAAFQAGTQLTDRVI